MMAERYSTRPSVLLDVSDPYAAYCVDQALTVRLAQHRRGEDVHQEDGDPRFPGTPEQRRAAGYGVPPSPEVLRHVRELRGA